MDEFNLYQDTDGVNAWVNNDQIELLQDTNQSDSTKKMILINQMSGFNEITLFLRRVTRGNVAIDKKMTFEVCGLEIVEFVTNKKSLEYSFEKYSGTLNEHKIQIAEIASLYRSNSTLC